MHTAVGAGAIILDAGNKLLGVQDILFCFNNKVYDPFAISFRHFHASIGDGAMILDAAANAFYDIIIVFDLYHII